LRDPVFSRFSLTPTCDRQTHEDGVYCASMASRGKKNNSGWTGGKDGHSLLTALRRGGGCVRNPSRSGGDNMNICLRGGESEPPLVKTTAQRNRLLAEIRRRHSHYITPRLRNKFGERTFLHSGPAAWNYL